MNKFLFTWLGDTDIRCSERVIGDLGPIAQAAFEGDFSHLIFLVNYGGGRSIGEINLNEENQAIRVFINYKEWLQKKLSSKIDITYHTIFLSNPTDHEKIYEQLEIILNRYNSTRLDDTKWAFHISPGTPAMHAVWLFFAKGKFEASLVQTSKKRSLTYVNQNKLLFSLENVYRIRDKRVNAGFAKEINLSDIDNQDDELKSIGNKLRRIAPRSVSVLLLGESGTGKTVIARAIHNASPRSKGSFVKVNCASIPENLFESELFGHKKGAFTGALVNRKGKIVAANGGTLFLDEIGELSQISQAKLLHVLEDNIVIPIGENEKTQVNVRYIFATNRNLQKMVKDGLFRQDLYFRLNKFEIEMPPLRRKSKASFSEFIVNVILHNINMRYDHESDDFPKQLSNCAINTLYKYKWPGNIRELENVLEKACLNYDEKIITTEHLHEHLPAWLNIDSNIKYEPIENVKDQDEILNRPFDENFSLPRLLSEVAKHYLDRAYHESGGNNTKAQNLIKLFKNKKTANNPTTFINWHRKKMFPWRGFVDVDEEVNK